MRIAVTTPTGNIGRKLTDRLLDQGAEVTLLARHPEKVQDLVDRGAVLRHGSLEDEAFVTDAIAGADALFWLTPSEAAAADLRARQNEFGRVAAGAIKANRTPRVVNLSSAGAQLSSGAGPVSGLHDVEKLLEGAAGNVTHLRPGFFFENLLMSLEPIKSMNSIFLPWRGEVPLHMIAARDIAEAAARRLLDPSWSGRCTMGLHGPKEMTMNEVAAVLSDVIGREIKFVQVSPEQAGEAMRGMGMSDGVTDVLLELYAAFDSGRFKTEEPRTPATTTPTTFAQFAEEVMRPLLTQASVS